MKVERKVKAGRPTSRRSFLAGIGSVVALITLSFVGILCFAPTDAEVTLVLDSPLAYTDRDAYLPTEILPVRIHASHATSGRLFRLGKRLEPIDISFTVDDDIQDPKYSYFKGFKWRVTKHVPLAGLRSGYYLLHLWENGGSHRTFEMPFIVKPAKPMAIALVASTNTWQAYNAFAGLSNYQDTRTAVRHSSLKGGVKGIMKLPSFWAYLIRRCAYRIRTGIGRRIEERKMGAAYYRNRQVPLPHGRPYTNISGEMSMIDRPKGRQSSHLLRAEWLLPAFLEEKGIDYGVYSDLDAESDPNVWKADLVVFNTHSEYWSSEMMAKLERFLASGGKVMFLSGNNIYREVKHDQWSLHVVNQKVDKRRTLSLTGAFYDTRDYNTYAPYVVKNASHWIFEGTGIENGERLGEKSLNGHRSFFEATGASGWETDKTEGDLPGLTLLAKGTNKDGGADMVFMEFPGGGWVFNASSITFTGALDDEVISKMMLNVIGRAVKK